MSNVATPWTMVSKEMAEAAVRAFAEGYTEGAKGKQKWLDNMTEDVVMQDPVGAAVRIGRARASRFFDGVYQDYFSSMSFTPKAVYPCGDQVAMTWTIKGHNKDGKGGVEFDGINIFKVDPSGKVKMVKAYFDPHQFRKF